MSLVARCFFGFARKAAGPFHTVHYRRLCRFCSGWRVWRCVCCPAATPYGFLFLVARWAIFGLHSLKCARILCAWRVIINE
jgi:hypothetical protein